MSIGRRMRLRRLARFPGMGDVRRYGRQLLGPQRRTAARALLDALFVSVTMKQRGLRPLLNEPRLGATTDTMLARRISGAVDACFGMLPLEPTCLRRSVTLKRELSRRGLTSTMHIGVRIVEEKIEAHAWVQVGSEVVNDELEVVVTYSEIAVGELDSLMPSFS